jgi:type III pantothenate kinase
MRLVIDIGNTRTKIAVFSGRTMFFVKAFERIGIADIKNIINQFPTIKKVIFSSVSFIDKDKEEIKEFLGQRFRFIEMNNDLILPITNHYLTPITLGSDRIAGVIGANSLFPENNCLVIDAGSCITLDLIDKFGNYYGGSISAGINMKYKALNTFTDSLPLIEGKFKEENIVGNDTQSSIRSGIINGTVMELEGFIAYYMNKYTDLKILFTGGDAHYLHSYFKENTILEEHLVLSGLNIILDTNA